MINNNVLIGLDGYLFLYDGGQHSFAFSTAEMKPAHQDILNFSNNLEQRSRYLKEIGIPFLHLVYPSKEVVVREKVPAPWKDKIQSLFLSSYVATQPGLLDLSLYPLDILRDLNRTKPVFRVLDSHMTDAGTMAVTQKILEKWGLNYEVDSFFSATYEKRRGDLADMLKTSDRFSEEFFQPKFKFSIFDNREYLPGNTGNVCIVHNQGSMTRKRLLVFGDSFIKYALPFLAPVFRDVVYVRSATFQPDIVDLMAPDFVISSNAERYLCKVESDASSKPFIFGNYGASQYKPSATFINAYAAQLSARHHRSAYDAWSRNMLVERLSWKGLGNCHPNQQVEVLDFLGNFRSTGLDPFLTFPATEISPDKCYVLEVDLKSNVDSLASVYFQEESDERFSESKSVKLPVKIGDNKLRFYLPDCRLKPILRFDPLNSQGNFSLKNIILKIVK